MKYTYYVTGSIGAGKTTCISYMGSFQTHEEWVEERHADLARSWKELSESEATALDSWILRQFRLKNFNLFEIKTGIHLVDRAPIDPLGFTTVEERPSKAKKIEEALRSGDPRPDINQGHVIFLVGDPTDMEARVVSRHKYSDSKVIGEIQDTIRAILEPYPHTPINTFSMGIPQVVKAVAKVVLLEEYKPVDITKCLQSLQSATPATAEGKL